MNEERSSSTPTVLLALAGGALLGAGLALLFAPQSGRKTRRQLEDLADEAVEKAQELRRDVSHSAEDLRRRGEVLVGQAKEFVEEKKAQVAAAMDGSRR